MRVATGKNYWPTLIGGTAIAVCVALGALFLGGRTVDDLIATSALTRTATFAEFLSSDPERVTALLSELTRDPEIETRVRTVASLSHFVAFAIYDAAGRETFATRAHDREWLLRDRPGGTTSGNRLSSASLQRDGAWQDIASTGDENPTVVMPLLRDGRAIAYLSAQPDLSLERHAYGQTLARASTLFVAILLMAAGLPLLFYVRRKNRIKEADERIFFLHNHDPLTKCINRRRMNEETDRMMATARATRERMAIWYLDVDGLAEINNTLGQAYGDELLQVIAARMAEVVDGNDLLSRTGSDDFAVLQRGVKGEESLKALAYRIQTAACKPLELNGQSIVPRITLGAALSPDHGRTYAELIKHAEVAFLHQKTLRRGEYALYQSWMDQEAHRRRTIERMLAAALENGRFELFYQPIYAGDAQTLLGFEALIRMPDGHGGYIPPSEFIPVAEARGYIKAIGSWVIAQACQQAALWPGDLFVSVNLSAVQFRDGDLVDIVKRALADAGIDGRRLGIEVVESLLLDQSDEVLSQLRALRDLGVSIDMDDFGTGYSSLGYLWRFPFDKLKIDQSFLHALRDGQSGALHIIQTIISLAHHLRLKVTAEGIETKEQAELLQSFGCDQLQGYYLARPQPACALAPIVLKHVSATPSPEPSPGVSQGALPAPGPVVRLEPRRLLALG